MKRIKEIKKIQIGGKKHFAPVADAEREKLLQRALALKAEAVEAKQEIKAILDRLIEISRPQSKDAPAVTLENLQRALALVAEVKEAKKKLKSIQDRFITINESLCLTRREFEFEEAFQHREQYSLLPKRRFH